MGKENHSVHSRLKHLEKELDRIKELQQRALSYRENDPETALMHARKAAEAVCRQLYTREVSPNPGNLMLDDLIDKLKSAGVLPRAIALPLRTIQGYGNYAAHEQGDESRDITSVYIQPCLQALAVVVDWYFREYQDSGVPEQQTQGPKDNRGPLPTACGSVVADGKPVRVSEFAARMGLTPAALIRIAREILQVELRTPSAILQPDQALRIQERIAETQATKPASAEVAPTKSLDLSGGVAMAFVLIPAGPFQMGSPVEEDGHNDDEIPHAVTISRAFYLSRDPVTQAQYQRIVGSNPSYFRGECLPVEMVSWFDAVSFCELLCERFGRKFRLPTEAEWEYACRAGTKTAFSTGARITVDQANFDGKIGAAPDAPGLLARWKTTPVDSFPPNAWGLHDMHGNVWEWCSDWYGEYSRTEAKDPTGPETGDIRVLRGGSWFHGAPDARSAQRDALDPGRRHSIYGFRVIMEAGR